MYGRYVSRTRQCRLLVEKKNENNLYLARARRFVRKRPASAEAWLSKAGSTRRDQSFELLLPNQDDFSFLSATKNRHFVGRL
jgi:hypothetical protein